MKIKHYGWALAVTVALAAPSWANKLPGDLVSGQVSAVSGNTTIKINGQIYRIKAGSPAEQAVRNVAAGQVVDAQLNGPANSSATEVVNVVVRGNR